MNMILKTKMMVMNNHVEKMKLLGKVMMTMTHLEMLEKKQKIVKNKMLLLFLANSYPCVMLIQMKMMEMN